MELDLDKIAQRVAVEIGNYSREMEEPLTEMMVKGRTLRMLKNGRDFRDFQRGGHNTKPVRAQIIEKVRKLLKI